MASKIDLGVAKLTDNENVATGTRTRELPDHSSEDALWPGVTALMWPPSTNYAPTPKRSAGEGGKATDEGKAKDAAGGEGEPQGIHLNTAPQ